MWHYTAQCSTQMPNDLNDNIQIKCSYRMANLLQYLSSCNWSKRSTHVFVAFHDYESIQTTNFYFIFYCHIIHSFRFSFRYFFKMNIPISLNKWCTKQIIVIKWKFQLLNLDQKYMSTKTKEVAKDMHISKWTKLCESSKRWNIWSTVFFSLLFIFLKIILFDFTNSNWSIACIIKNKPVFI